MSNRKDAVLVRRIVPGDHGYHAIESERSSRVDAFDDGVRIRRVQDLTNQHAGKREIIGVLPCSGRLAGGVDKRDGLSDY